MIFFFSDVFFFLIPQQSERKSNLWSNRCLIRGTLEHRFAAGPINPTGHLPCTGDLNIKILKRIYLNEYTLNDATKFAISGLLSE